MKTGKVYFKSPRDSSPQSPFAPSNMGSGMPNLSIMKKYPAKGPVTERSDEDSEIGSSRITESPLGETGSLLLIPEKILTEGSTVLDQETLGQPPGRPRSKFITFKDLGNDKEFESFLRAMRDNPNMLKRLQDKLVFNRNQHFLLNDHITRETFKAYSQALSMDPDLWKPLKKKPKIKVISVAKEHGQKQTISTLESIRRKTRLKGPGQIAVKIALTVLANDPYPTIDSKGIPELHEQQGKYHYDHNAQINEENVIFNAGGEFNFSGPQSKTSFAYDIKTRLNGIRTFNMIFTTTSSQNVRTDSRDGHTMTFIDNKGFIIGGLSKAPTDQVTVYDTKAEDFKDFKLTGQPPGERSHHTTIAIKKCLYIFGGESISGQNIVLRPVSNELWKLDTSNFFKKKKRCDGVVYVYRQPWDLRAREKGPRDDQLLKIHYRSRGHGRRLEIHQ
jgi:hypothetical protein